MTLPQLNVGENAMLTPLFTGVESIGTPTIVVKLQVADIVIGDERKNLFFIHKSLTEISL